MVGGRGRLLLVVPEASGGSGEAARILVSSSCRVREERTYSFLGGEKAWPLEDEEGRRAPPIRTAVWGGD